MPDNYQAKMTITGRNPGDNTIEVYRTAGTACDELAATYRNQHYWIPTGRNWFTRKWISGEDQNDGFAQCVCVRAKESCEDLCERNSPGTWEFTVSGVSGSNNCPSVPGKTVDCDNFNRTWQCVGSDCGWGETVTEWIDDVEYNWRAVLGVSVSVFSGFITIQLEFRNIVSNVGCGNVVKYEYTTPDPIDCASITLSLSTTDFGSGWPSTITITGG